MSTHAYALIDAQSGTLRRTNRHFHCLPSLDGRRDNLLLLVRRESGTGLVAARVVLAGAHGDRLEVVQRAASGALLEEHPALEPPGDGLGDLILHEGSDGDSEDPVELFQGTLHGLGDPEEDHDEGDNVEASVDTEDTL